MLWICAQHAAFTTPLRLTEPKELQVANSHCARLQHGGGVVSVLLVFAELGHWSPGSA